MKDSNQIAVATFFDLVWTSDRTPLFDGKSAPQAELFLVGQSIFYTVSPDWTRSADWTNFVELTSLATISEEEMSERMSQASSPGHPLFLTHFLFGRRLQPSVH